jgi:hypothetical protein
VADGRFDLGAERAGPGIGASVGTLQVSLAQPGKLRESFIERRGMVTFSLTFVESIDITQPSLSVDSQQAARRCCR